MIRVNSLGNKYPQKREHYLDNMRAIAIIMVVGVHSIAYSIELPKNQEEIITFVVQTIAVPVFFLVDGYIYANSSTNTDNQSYFKYVRKSSFRLLIPWALFTFFYSLTRYIFEFTGFLEEKSIIGHSWQEVAVSAYASVYAPQMYFLLSLFLIRLCTPILHLLFIRNSYLLTLLLFTIYFVVYIYSKPIISHYLNIAGGQEPITHALWGLQFYLVGIILFKTSLIVEIRKLFIPFALSFSIALYLQITYKNTSDILIQYLYLLTFFTFFTLTQIRSSLINFLGRNTMGIYLIHAPIVLKGTSLIINNITLIPILSYVSVLIGSLTLSILIIAAINRVPYSCLIFGAPYHRSNS